MKEIMKQEEKKLISILSLLVVISIIILIITIALPRLKRTEKEVAKQQVDKMKENYATNATDFGDISENGDGSVTASLSTDGVLRISGTGNMKNYTSSSSLSDVPWYSVGDTIKSVVIESGVTSIGSNAFYCCSSLTQIEIPSGVTSIGSNAFYYCSSLTQIEIPSGVTSIGSNVFLGCSSLTQIEIPSGVTSIGSYAFYNCSSLTQIEIPSGVTSIGSKAFYNCSSLTQIEIPSGVTSIGGRAFEECSSLTQIVVDKENEKYKDEKGVLYTKDEKKIIKYPEGKTETKYTILSGVTSIGDSAFWKCSKLTEIEIPSGVTIIETYAFDGCSKLTIITNQDAEYVIKYAKEKDIKYMTIGYSETNVTNKDVIVTIESNKQIQEVNDWTLSEDKLKLTKTYTSNTTASGEKVTIKDLAGNETEVTVKITNIDKEAPKAGVSYSTTSPTSGSVVATITSNEKIQEVNGWTISTDKLKLTKTYTSNTTASGEKVTIKDLAGNATEVTVKITNIDKEAPKAEVSYSTTALTNGSVVVTITSNEEIQEVSGWTLSEDKLKLTRTYTSNTTASGEKVTIKDLAGNETEVTVKITNIDKEAPKVTVSYSTTSSTTESVIVTITSNEEIQEVSGWTLSTDKLKLTKTYTSNTTASGENITIKDLAGNTSVVNVKITNIEKPTEEYFNLTQYKIKDKYIVKIEPNTKYSEFIKDIQTNMTYTIKEGSKVLDSTSIMKTGQVLTVGNNSYTIVVMGDLNGDGNISLVELARISKIGAGKITDVSEIEKTAIDVNVDGKINLIDLASIAKKYASK